MPIADFTALETPRLRLRHFTDTDLLAFMAYRNDPEVARYQSWEGISEPEARAFIQEQTGIQPGVPGQWFRSSIPILIVPPGALFFLLVFAWGGLQVDARWRPQ